MRNENRKEHKLYNFNIIDDQKHTLITCNIFFKGSLEPNLKLSCFATECNKSYS